MSETRPLPRPAARAPASTSRWPSRSRPGSPRTASRPATGCRPSASSPPGSASAGRPSARRWSRWRSSAWWPSGTATAPCWSTPAGSTRSRRGDPRRTPTGCPRSSRPATRSRPRSPRWPRRGAPTTTSPRIDEALAVMARDIEAGGRGVEGDERFHGAVTAAAHSLLLARLMDEIGDLIRETRIESLSQPGRPRDSLAGHRAIADAIRAGDPDAAAAAHARPRRDGQRRRAAEHLRKSSASRRCGRAATGWISPSSVVVGAPIRWRVRNSSIRRVGHQGSHHPAGPDHPGQRHRRGVLRLVPARPVQPHLPGDGHPEGGMEIEQLAEERPDALAKIPVERADRGRRGQGRRDRRRRASSRPTSGTRSSTS